MMISGRRAVLSGPLTSACMEAELSRSVYTSPVCIFTAVNLIRRDTFDFGVPILLTTAASNSIISLNFFQQLDICEGKG